MKNEELVRAGKEAMTSFQETEERLTMLEEQKVELTCRLHSVSDTVFDKEAYYEDILEKWKAGIDKTIEDEASGRVKREMEW